MFRIVIYKTHYHPSNAIFMTCGDLSTLELQTQFEDRVLNRFKRSSEHISVENEKRMTSPINVEETYALDEADQSGDKNCRKDYRNQ